MTGRVLTRLGLQEVIDNLDTMLAVTEVKSIDDETKVQAEVHVISVEQPFISICRNSKKWKQAKTLFLVKRTCSREVSVRARGL